MKELAPQSSDGDYTRPSYGYVHSIGSPEFPVRLPTLNHLAYPNNAVLSISSAEFENTCKIQGCCLYVLSSTLDQVSLFDQIS